MDRALTPGRYRFLVWREGLSAHVQTKSRLARWLSVAKPNLLAITIGRRIYCVGAIEGLPPALIPHEFEHVRQWAALGTWGFLRRYVAGLVRYGYGPRHPMEAEAIRAQNDDATARHFWGQWADALAMYRRARGIAA